ncbi:hypothetical protein [Streptomyces sp. NBC_01320]|uniref:hypothetical protein n=1 Tax=Streptomyces sp. NBC_01320 TaxID=2903824 RepID=UPI002E14C20A|nr:hypothetical protein OG395_23420 [Streptomyces sp. NBC_01320]
MVRRPVGRRHSDVLGGDRQLSHPGRPAQRPHPPARGGGRGRPVSRSPGDHPRPPRRTGPRPLRLFASERDREEAYYQVFERSIDGGLPSPFAFGSDIEATYGTTHTETELKRYVERFANRYDAELAEDHIT